MGSKHADPVFVPWEGARWSPVPSHIPRVNGNLEAATVHTAGDVWAFGGAYYVGGAASPAAPSAPGSGAPPSAAQGFEPITDHWDGSVWTPVGELWAVGVVDVSRDPPRSVRLVEHISPAA